MDINEFEKHRSHLFSVAYRMLGSASEAEDVVQDAWLRSSAAAKADVRSPRAYLMTVVTRLALDRLKSARVTREQYVGPWLPEPVLTDSRPEPEESVALAESLTLAFMVLLDTLSPEERAVFVLREVLEYSYAEIAEVLKITEANCRQMFHRAKERLRSGHPHSERSREQKRELAARFVDALRAGDSVALTRVLAEDVGFWGDGGGRVPAARRPILGRDAVVNLLLGLRRTAEANGYPLEKIRVDVVEVNYEPAMLVCVEGRVDSVYVCSIVDDAIAAIRVVRNPDKLVYLAHQLNTEPFGPATRMQ
ncbi:MAG TPA: RNA polymerase sigma-70 factor [Vicinamibacterales bacterium]|jgi:RNA polymerase sigma-70 factor (ECF subfamily)